MEETTVHHAAQNAVHPTKKPALPGFFAKSRLQWGTLFILGLFSLGGGAALAAGLERATPGFLRVAATAGTASNPTQIKNFAVAVGQIKQLNEQVHTALSQKGLTAAKRENLKQSYMTKVDGVLASNHLTAEQYSSMLKKTQTDPAFAKQVEAAMQ